MKKTIITKFKVGDTFFFLEGDKVGSGTVDKIEIFSNYFRYVNDNRGCKINWFTNEQVDNEPDLKEGESQMGRIFTSKDKVFLSRVYRKARKHFLENEIENYTKELFNLREEMQMEKGAIK